MIKSAAPDLGLHFLEVRLAAHSLMFFGAQASHRASVLAYFVLSYLLKFAWNSLA